MNYSKTIIEEIKQQYGLPCYVFDEQEFRKNFIHLSNALREEYALYTVAYSFKTNYAPKFCQIAKELGAYAEVVSDMECSIAKRVGFEYSKIIYNGPYKGPMADELMLNGGILNIDNFDEAKHIVELAGSTGEVLKVGLRVNIDVGQNFISRFGIDADSEDISEIISVLKNNKNIKIVGLHCHIGRARNIEAWERRTKQLLALSDRYIEGVPEYLDLGSGMFGEVDECLKQQFKYSIPTYEEYAAVTARIVNEHYKNSINKPILFTEPGTTVDNKYMDLVTEVHAVKHVRKQDFAVMNCSIHNLGDACNDLQLPIAVFNNSKTEMVQDLNMVGYTCLEQDVVYRGYTGFLSKGDYVVFGNVGGYSNVVKPPFILPQCAMIGINNSGSYVIKRKETVDDILSTYMIQGD